jgi:hypothetical protein
MEAFNPQQSVFTPCKVETLKRLRYKDSEWNTEKFTFDDDTVAAIGYKIDLWVVLQWVFW